MVSRTPGNQMGEEKQSDTNQRTPRGGLLTEEDGSLHGSLSRVPGASSKVQFLAELLQLLEAQVSDPSLPPQLDPILASMELVSFLSSQCCFL